MMGIILTVVLVVMILVLVVPSGGTQLPAAPEDRSILQSDSSSGEVWSNSLPPIVASLDANASPITNMLDPLEDTDAATKGYVDRSTGSVPGGVTASVQYNDDSIFEGDAQFTYNNGMGILAVPFAETELRPGVQGGISGLGVQSTALNMGGHNINNVNTVNGDLSGTVLQAAQPSITSIGTQAADLDMGGNDINNAGTVNGNLNGTVLQAAQPSITSIGTQAADLDMGGNDINNAGTVNGNLNGTVLQAAQPSITSIGTQAADLDMGGNDINNAGTVNGDLNGTVLQAAQPSITSIGTQAADLDMGGNDINNTGTVNGDLNGTVLQAAQPSITSIGTQAADLDMGSNRITNLSTTEASNVSSDAASVQFVLDNSSAQVPGGVDTSVQYKDGTAFEGSASFTYDDVTGILDVPNITVNDIAIGDGTLTRPSLLFNSSTNSGVLWDSTNSAVQIVSGGTVRASFESSQNYLGETYISPILGEDAGLFFRVDRANADNVSSQIFFDENENVANVGFRFTYAATANVFGLDVPDNRFVFSSTNNTASEQYIWGVDRIFTGHIDYYSNYLSNIGDNGPSDPGVQFNEGTSGGPCGIYKRDAGPTGEEMGMTLGGVTQLVLDKANVYTGNFIVSDASSGEPNLSSESGVKIRTIVQDERNSAMEIRFQEYANTHLNGFTMGFDGTNLDVLGYGLPTNTFSLRSYYRFGASNITDTIFFIYKNNPTVNWMSNRLTNVSVSSSNDTDAANVQFVKNWVANVEPAGLDGYIQYKDGNMFNASANLSYDSSTGVTSINQLVLGASGDISDPTLQFDSGDGFFANTDGIYVTDGGVINSRFKDGLEVYTNGATISMVGDDHTFMEFCNNSTTSDRMGFLGKDSAVSDVITLRAETENSVAYGIDIVADGNIRIDAQGGDLELDAGVGDIRLTNNTEVDGVIHTNQGTTSEPTHSFSSRRTTGLYYDSGAGGWGFTNGGTRNIYCTTANTIVMDFSASSITFEDGLVSPSPNASVDLGTNAASFGTMYTNGVLVTSDETAKKNIRPLNNGLGIIRQVEPVSYAYRHDANENERWGVIAQTTEERLRQAGITHSVVKVPTEEQKANGGNYTVNYLEFIAPLMGATKTLDTTVESLRSRVIELEATLELVLSRLQTLENK